MLLTLAMVSAAASVVAARWADQDARTREQHLLRIGDQYARALADYLAAAPGQDRRPPQQLQQLLLDTRFAGTRRHLRALYPDPVTGRPDWVLVRDARGDIIGLHSASVAQPWAQVALSLAHCELPAARRYADWVFQPSPPSPPNQTRKASS